MKFKEFLKTVKPGDKRIRQPYLIAEIGVNHECKMEIAKQLIEEAVEGGADAVKFQTYKAGMLAMGDDSPSYWDLNKEPTRSQFDLFKKYDHFNEKEFMELKEYCDLVNIEFLSTPFDVHSAVWLNNLMDVIKISSSDITNKPFIEFLCKFKKTIILSTGAADLNEIQEAISWIKPHGNEVVLLHCVLNYPTDNANANLGRIIGLQNSFSRHLIGYSDHTCPSEDMKVLQMAAILGAHVIEKHFTHDKKLPGNDHYHAMDKEDIKSFRLNMRKNIEIYGNEEVKYLESEKISRLNARRSLVAVRDIPEGKCIEPDDLTWKRPASGISPRDIDKVIGKKTLRDIPCDSPIVWENLESHH